jgi:hypothetical protein
MKQVKLVDARVHVEWKRIFVKTSTVNEFNVTLQRNPPLYCVTCNAPMQSSFSFSFEYTVERPSILVAANYRHTLRAQFI